MKCEEFRIYNKMCAWKIETVILLSTSSCLVLYTVQSSIQEHTISSQRNQGFATDRLCDLEEVIFLCLSFLSVQ